MQHPSGDADSHRGKGATNKHCFRHPMLFALVNAGSAEAADLGSPRLPPRAPIFSWTGYYIGGGFWTSRKDFSQGTTTNDFTMSGVVGGLAAGYNQQFGSIVVGLVGDISASGIKRTTEPTEPIIHMRHPECIEGYHIASAVALKFAGRARSRLDGAGGKIE